MRSLIFSRDRALQLEAALTSFSRRCVDSAAVPVDVLYTATSPHLERQYALLARTWRGAAPVTFHRETDFRGDVLGLLGAQDRLAGRRPPLPLRAARAAGRRTRDRLAARRDRAPYVLLLVDDAVFCRPFSLADAAAALEERPRALGFSLRIGRNTEYCYMLDAPQRPPAFQRVTGEILAYDWTRAEHDYGYPLEVSSSIYSRARIGRILAGIGFFSPNSLEGALAQNACRWARRTPELLCFERSVAFCNAVNVVQAEFDNRAGAAAELSAPALARRFDDGLRIDTERFAGFTPDACHCELPYSFVPAAPDAPPPPDEVPA